MQVQKIQSTDSSRKPCFKAKFVNDLNGNFRRMWQAADKTIVGCYADSFENFSNHKLEITNVRNISVVSSNFAYDIFNHNTGKNCTVYLGLPAENDKTLYNLICEIMDHKDIFEEDNISKIYNKIADHS